MFQKRPSKKQWSYFFRVLGKKEKKLFFLFFFASLFSFAFIIQSVYIRYTKEVPSQKGAITEGLLGQPRFINPVYANSDADRDLNQLLFSGLMKYDENLQIVPDLASKYEISEDKRTYIFYLKEDVYWQDKTPITADDVVFTIKTIQDPEAKSPFRANWVGVEVEKLNDLSVKFSLKQPYGSFLENAAIKLIPSHIWQNIPIQNLPLEIYNLNPVASGPYKIKEIEQDKKNQIRSITLTANPLYFGQYPNIVEIKFLFYNTEEELAKAAKTGALDSFSLASLDYISNKEAWNINYLTMPRYFSVFFNQEKSKVLSDINVRKALNYAVDKKDLLKQIFGEGYSFDKEIVSSPALPKLYELKEPSNPYQYDLAKAKDLLEKAGFKDYGQGYLEKEENKELSFQFKRQLKLNSSGTDVRELQKCLAKFPDIYPNGEVNGSFGEKTEQAVIKFQEKYKDEILKPSGFAEGTGQVSSATIKKLNEVCFNQAGQNIPLKISLAVVDQPQMVKLANILKSQWEKIGVQTQIVNLPISRLEQEYIKPREYEALLFGEVLGAIPDLLPFWHSSQKRDPGLNLALYDNKDADKLLEEARKVSEEARREKLSQFQDILLKDAPAVFLYAPDYVYFASKEIKNITIKKIVDPSKRFVGIENWYTKTKKVWK